MQNSREWNFAGCLVERLGENSCLIDAPTGRTLCGSEVASSIVGFAAGFRSAGLQPGDRLLIGCEVSLSSTLAYLGAMYAGVIPVLAEQRALSTSGELLVAKARPKALWTAEEESSTWMERTGISRIHGEFAPIPPHSLPPVSCLVNDVASLMPTSGSTGVPRLVMVTHGNLGSNTEAIIRSQQLGTDERAMLIMPVSYCFGASIMQTHLYQGGGVVFDSRFMFPDKVLRASDSFHCTTFAGVPAVYNILVRRSNLNALPLPSLRRLLQAGGALTPKGIREMRKLVPAAEFFVMYGQTEATARISCLPPSHLSEKLGSAGLPLDNLRVRIVGKDGRELPTGQVGEIQVRGPSVCAGYFEDPQETERKFGEGWLKTGDFALSDEQGYLWVKGRTEEFIKIRGVRVSLGEVETKVASVSGVYECAALATNHVEAGEALAIFVVPEGNPDGLVEKVRRALPPQWTCEFIKVIPKLPKTENNKIARAQLRSML